MSLDADQRERYWRNLLLPGFGEAGQERLLTASALVIGAGGLGSPAAFYLVAAGIGALGLADAGLVDRSNLQRQILHGTADIDRPKVESARERLEALNPAVRIVCHRQRVDAASLPDLIAGYEVVVDATDNFATKFAINDACVAGGIPLVHAGVLDYGAQLLTVRPGVSACLRCVFGGPPATGPGEDDEVGGVLGALPGAVGSLQAAEAIKLLLDIGDPLTDRLLTCDLAAMRFDEHRVTRDLACAACGIAVTRESP